LKENHSFGMSTDHDSARDPGFLDIDSFDMDMVSGYGHDLDPLDDVLGFDCDFPREPDLGPYPEGISDYSSPRQPENAYDLGMSARYRAYPIEASTVHRHLRHMHGLVTKEMLQSFITALRRRCPPSTRPAPPTRAQRRAKGGLVAWLDENESMALSYLRLPDRRV
jgi:hypothetical protein